MRGLPLLGAIAAALIVALMVSPSVAILPAAVTSRDGSPLLPAAPTGLLAGSGASGSPGAGSTPSGSSSSASTSQPAASLPSNCLKFGKPASGEITPCLLSTPVPMGVSDLGVGPSGAYNYTTPSFVGNLTVRSFSAFSPGYPASALAPDWVRIELDTVAVNVALPHATVGTYWIQNGVHFNGTSLTFEDNVWNFSGPNESVGATALTGQVGQILRDEFYVGVGPTYTVTLPMTLRLFNNLTIVGGHARVYFNYTVSAAGGFSASGSYDNVTFAGAASPASPPEFEVNGSEYNPAGLLYDAEFVIGGNGDGANANVVTLNATATLDEWDSGTLSYAPIRSAYDFGADSGETALGIAAYWIGTTEYLNQGPSILEGLWNTPATSFVPSAMEGWILVSISVTPSYAFLFETNETGIKQSTRYANFSYTPTTVTGLATAFLPPTTPGNGYVFEAWADGYANASTSETPIFNNTTSSQGLPLAASSSKENAPVYLATDAQAALLGSAGITGIRNSATLQALWLNDTTADLAPPFLRLNEYSYPTFVLFAAQGLSYAVTLSAFLQSSLTFTYTEYQNEAVLLVGWTQGYFFFGGTGAFSVADTTISGNSTLYSDRNPTYPPATVEFYGTHASSASNILAKSDTYGVAVVDAPDAVLTNLTSETGASGALVLGSEDATLNLVAASGSDPIDGSPSVGATLYNDTSVVVDRVTASDGASGVLSEGIGTLTLTGLTASGGAIGLALNTTNDSHLVNVTVADDSSYAGWWNNSTTISVKNLASRGIGLDFENDSGVTVVGASALGLGASAIDAVANTSGGQFSSINATDDAFGVNATNSTDLVLSACVATGGSVGAALENVTAVTATDLTATNTSIALSWFLGSTGTISDVSVASEPSNVPEWNVTGSPGVVVSNVTGVTISLVTATGAPGLADYMLSPSNGSYFAVAAVAIANSSDSKILNVSAVEYPYTVLANNSTTLTIDGVESWYGNVSVLLNDTNLSTVTHVFAYGDEIGAALFYYSTSDSVTNSSFEGCVQVGMILLNATTITVTKNNFVATNNSSVSGVFEAAHEQAFVNGSIGLTFSGNFWSDHTGTGAYPISNGTDVVVARDSSPATKFVSTWLVFEESGLPGGTNWTFAYAGAAYSSVVSRVYLPGWSLALHVEPFSVGRAAGLKPSPASGSLRWDGTNQTQSITYVTGLPFDLPLSVYLAIAGGAAAAVLVIVGLLVWRRRPRAKDPGEGEDALAPEGPTPPSAEDRHKRRYG
jgi:Thermopsin